MLDGWLFYVSLYVYFVQVLPLVFLRRMCTYYFEGFT